MRLLFTILLFSIYVAATAQIPSYVPTNGLVGWWPFNGNANDESGNGNNGTPMNGITLTTDRFGNPNSAYLFDGINDYINLGDMSYSIDNLQQFTLTYWFKSDLQFPTYSGLNVGGTFAHWTTMTGSTFNGIEVGTDQSGGTTIAVRGGEGSPNVGLILPNQTTFITITFDGTAPINQRFGYYLNGIFIQNFSLPTSIIQLGSVGNKTIIGGYLGSIPPDNVYFYFKGILDDFGIWHRALTQSEITQLYTGTVTPSVPEDTTSNVGIGTITPKRKLHVNDVMRLEPRSTAPANPAKGDIYFDGVLNKLRVYDGSVWQSCW